MANPITKSSLPSRLLRSHITSSLTPSTQLRQFHPPKPNTRVFQISPEITAALANKTPIVALESQIYTHGHGYTTNFASHLETLVREHGAIPATIAVLDGVARVGMSEEELLRVADSVGREETMKVSRRDLSLIAGLGIAGKKLIGGTTISATMLLAQMAGIEILGTGGLGGVHRGGENSLDISADLTELGRTRVTVISSGCKNFLDLPRTLEYLETQGVCVSTFADGREGNEIDMPSFYSRDSGVRSPSVVNDEKEAAAVIFAHRLFDMNSGILLANPISEEHSIPYKELHEVIEAAVREAAEKGYHGPSNTPFILARIKERTAGRSIPANRAMIEANVIKAAKVAVELSRNSQE